MSAKSLGNWVAKTHFLLLDGLGLTVGEQAAVRLPVHWLAAPILLGCWFAGLEVLSEPAGPVPVGFADAGALAERPLAADELYAVSLLSMARPDVPPPGAEDFTSAVRPMPDAWAGVRAQAGPDDPGLDGASRADRWSPPAWPPPIGWAWPPVAGCCGPAPAPDRRTGSAGCSPRWRSAARWCWCATRIRPGTEQRAASERVTARH